jgi:hypothetical protein
MAQDKRREWVKLSRRYLPSLAAVFLLAAAPRIIVAQGNAANGIDAVQAKQYFDEASRICQLDAGALWGKRLCAPMIFADQRTRSVVANQADVELRLRPQGGVFVGSLTPEVNIANTAMTWAGVKWTMIAWPLPASPTARDRLMMHELFHHLQDDLGLPGSNPVNAHLATLEGRIWLELEWRALQQALARPERGPAERKRAVEDAVLFRLQRRALFPNAAEQERELEMNEGLAEYTGYKLRGTAEAATIEAVIVRLSDAASEKSFSRSFAYVSGPAYGMLLDLAGAPWRKGLTPKNDLGDLSCQAYGVTLPRDIAATANERAAVYDGAALRWLETRQAKQRESVLHNYQSRLIEGAVLTLPVMEKFDFSYDPNEVIPLDESRTIYPTLRVTDVWGLLEVNDGALVVRGQSRFVGVVVQAPRPSAGNSGVIEGPGWKLTLSPGWRLAEGTRKGDLRLSNTE